VKRLTVIIPPSVQQQITAQVLYIAQDSINNALAWEDRLRAAIDAIGKIPGQTIDEDASGRLGEIHKSPVAKVLELARIMFSREPIWSTTE
jgi:plasmid stabilization system protein ParE